MKPLRKKIIGQTSTADQVLGLTQIQDGRRLVNTKLITQSISQIWRKILIRQ